MELLTPLRRVLDYWAGDDRDRRAIATAVAALANAGREIGDIVAEDPWLFVPRTDYTPEGRQPLDLRAAKLLIEALGCGPVGTLSLTTAERPLVRWSEAPLAAALVPLDGLSVFDTNEAVATIFSILPGDGSGRLPEQTRFQQPGRNQLAAGYLLYGPRTLLALTLGEGTMLFTYSRATASFRLTCDAVRIPSLAAALEGGAQNGRIAEERMRTYVRNCPKRGDRVRDLLVSPCGSTALVPNCHRVLSRGGVHHFPADLRDDGTAGRLRLVHEANPIALLIEQAGGEATDGSTRVLDIVPEGLAQRTPLIIGGGEELVLVDRQRRIAHCAGEAAPLFGRRGLFRG